MLEHYPSEALPLIAKNMALVSNSGSMLGSKKGHLIDSYNNVARFNNYVLKEQYNVDIGAKSNIWVTSCWHDIKLRPNTFDYVLVPKPIDSFLLPSANWHYHNGDLDAYETVKLKGDTATRERIAQFKDYRMVFMPLDIYHSIIKRHHHPSTGLLMIWWIWKQFNFFNAGNHFGFDFFTAKRHHYYHTAGFSTHNSKSEVNIYNELKMATGDV